MIDYILSILLTQTPEKNCLPQYPRTVSGEEICIPPPPPDLDCDDIGKAVVVVYDLNSANDADNDPHKLDSDGDGVGCESYSNSK